jgi:hypothetical protein
MPDRVGDSARRACDADFADTLDAERVECGSCALIMCPAEALFRRLAPPTVPVYWPIESIEITGPSGTQLVPSKRAICIWV